MSRDWTPEELAKVSKIMKAQGYMSYEEFCEEFDRQNIAKPSSKSEHVSELQTNNSID